MNLGTVVLVEKVAKKASMRAQLDEERLRACLRHHGRMKASFNCFRS